MTTQTVRNPVKGRRQRRVARRREEILDAAARIFAEQGYASATTRAVADAADLAEGTLYNYFGGKRDILLAIAQRAETEVAALLDETDRVDSVEAMVALVERGLRLLISHLPFTRTLWMEAWTDDEILRDFGARRLKALHSRIRIFIEEQIALHAFRDVDPALASTMVLGLVFAPIFPVLRGMVPPPSAEDLHDVAKVAVTLMLHGLVAESQAMSGEGCRDEQ